MIGPSSIVGTGAVVTRDVPPNTISAGNPAKAISRLDEYHAKNGRITHKKGVFEESYFIEHLMEEKNRDD